MKNIILALVLLNFATAHAVEMEAFKSSSTGLTVYTESALAKQWASNVPTCLKDGGKTLRRNAAYVKFFGDDKSKCSMSPAAKRKARVLSGTEVVVIRVAELPDSLLKSVSKN